MGVLAFRASDDFVEQTRGLAELFGLSSADYLRAAVEEKNRQMMEERMVMLSRMLSTASAKANQELEGTLTDGI